MIGVDACQRSFCIAFAFLSGEDENDYIWALDQLQSIYELYDIRQPSVILTDRCLACINAISRCFPASKSLLCIWHANKAVLSYCKPAFDRDDEDSNSDERWAEFFGYWHSIVGSKDEETFDQQVEELEKRFVPRYVKEAWVDQYAHFGNVATSGWKASTHY
ncbi:MULE transposase [Hirsutella rhossiliensis]